MTLCTIVANLTTGEVVLLGRDREPVTIPLADLARGRATQQMAGPPSPRVPGRRAGVLGAAGEKAAEIRRPPDAGWGALARGSMVSTSERISNVVI